MQAFLGGNLCLTPLAVRIPMGPMSSQKGRILTIPLDQLFLDPNNYRFIDREDYKEVSGNNVYSKKIQDRTQKWLLGRKQENVRDLIDSLRSDIRRNSQSERLYPGRACFATHGGN